MAALSEALGKQEKAQDYERRAADLADAINKTMWDETDGFYYDRNERSGMPVKVKSITGFMPLWAGIAPADRAKRLVEEHLLNENRFWTPYPVATWSKDEPDYYQEKEKWECNWRGPVWVPTNYVIFHGLRKYGYEDAARVLARRTAAMALDEPHTREYYNAETGSGMGLNPFWGWSALAYLMPLEWAAGYDPTSLEDDVRPLASELMGISFKP